MLETSWTENENHTSFSERLPLFLHQVSVRGWICVWWRTEHRRTRPAIRSAKAPSPNPPPPGPTPPQPDPPCRSTRVLQKERRFLMFVLYFNFCRGFYLYLFIVSNRVNVDKNVFKTVSVFSQSLQINVFTTNFTRSTFQFWSVVLLLHLLVTWQHDALYRRLVFIHQSANTDGKYRNVVRYS